MSPRGPSACTASASEPPPTSIWISSSRSSDGARSGIALRIHSRAIGERRINAARVVPDIANHIGATARHAGRARRESQRRTPASRAVGSGSTRRTASRSATTEHACSIMCASG